MQRSGIGWKLNVLRCLAAIMAGVVLLVPTVPTVLGQESLEASDTRTGDQEAAPAAFFEPVLDRAGEPAQGELGDSLRDRAARWTASAEFLLLERIGTVPYMLVKRVPGGHMTDPGTEALDATDLHQGFAGGPRLGLTRHGQDGYDLELSYFQIDGWNSTRSIYPADPQDWRWLTMRCPGEFLQGNEMVGQGMVWQYASRLNNAEMNLRWSPGRRASLLAGIRWVRLHENLQGALEPPTISWEPPFWNTATTNNLYGLQIGANGRLFELGHFSIDGLVKAGMFDNNAVETTGVSTIKVVRPSSASTNHAAFVGETGLQCRYEVTRRLTLKLGYEAIWIQGVALAPGQIDQTYMTTPTTAVALGVNCKSGVFYHGATTGFEYSF